MHEVDFDINSPLYDAIGTSDWDAASHACQCNPIEAETWVVRRDGEPKNKEGYEDDDPAATDNILWRFLPLHSACARRPPPSFLRDLLEAYPEAASLKDASGMYPLHYACGNRASKHVIEQLIECFPQAVRESDPQGMLPLHYIAQWGPSEDGIVEALLGVFAKGVMVLNEDRMSPVDLCGEGNFDGWEDVLDLCVRSAKIVKRVAKKKKKSKRDDSSFGCESYTGSRMSVSLSRESERENHVDCIGAIEIDKSTRSTKSSSRVRRQRSSSLRTTRSSSHSRTENIFESRDEKTSSRRQRECSSSLSGGEKPPSHSRVERSARKNFCTRDVMTSSPRSSREERPPPLHSRANTDDFDTHDEVRNHFSRRDVITSPFRSSRDERPPPLHSRGSSSRSRAGRVDTFEHDVDAQDDAKKYLEITSSPRSSRDERPLPLHSRRSSSQSPTERVDTFVHDVNAQDDAENYLDITSSPRSSRDERPPPLHSRRSSSRSRTERVDTFEHDANAQDDAKKYLQITASPQPLRSRRSSSRSPVERVNITHVDAQDETSTSSGRQHESRSTTKNAHSLDRIESYHSVGERPQSISCSLASPRYHDMKTPRSSGKGPGFHFGMKSPRSSKHSVGFDFEIESSLQNHDSRSEESYAEHDSAFTNNLSREKESQQDAVNQLSQENKADLQFMNQLSHEEEVQQQVMEQLSQEKEAQQNLINELLQEKEAQQQLMHQLSQEKEAQQQIISHLSQEKENALYQVSVLQSENMGLRSTMTDSKMMQQNENILFRSKLANYETIQNENGQLHAKLASHDDIKNENAQLHAQLAKLEDIQSKLTVVVDVVERRESARIQVSTERRKRLLGMLAMEEKQDQEEKTNAMAFGQQVRNIGDVTLGMQNLMIKKVKHENEEKTDTMAFGQQVRNICDSPKQMRDMMTKEAGNRGASRGDDYDVMHRYTHIAGYRMNVANE